MSIFRDDNNYRESQLGAHFWEPLSIFFLFLLSVSLRKSKMRQCWKVQIDPRSMDSGFCIKFTTHFGTLGTTSSFSKGWWQWRKRSVKILSSFLQDLNWRGDKLLFVLNGENISPGDTGWIIRILSGACKWTSSALAVSELNGHRLSLACSWPLFCESTPSHNQQKGLLMPLLSQANSL